MFTTDIALREDPGFRKITQSWQKNPQEFADAVVRLLNDSALQSRMKTVAAEWVRTRYSWESLSPQITQQLEALDAI